MREMLGRASLNRLQPLGDEFRAQEGRARNIPTRPSETGHEPVANRIAHSHHDDGNGGGCLLCGTASRRSHRDDDIDLETGEFGRQSRKALDSPVRRSVFNQDVLALHIAVLAQSLPQGVDPRRLKRLERPGHQVTYPCNLPRLLRFGGERRGEDGTRDAGDERSPVHHSIT